MLRLQKYKNWWRDGVIITIQRLRWWAEHLEGDGVFYSANNWQYFRILPKICIFADKKTAMDRMIQNDVIIQHFMPMGLFKTSDIAAWFRESEPDLKDSTINWRVYELVKDGVLSRVSKGVFKVGKNRSYHPVADAKLKKLVKTICKQFPFAEFCLWDTAVVNNFSHHLTAQGFYVVAVEKDAAESVFISCWRNWEMCITTRQMMWLTTTYIWATQSLWCWRTWSLRHQPKRLRGWKSLRLKWFWWIFSVTNVFSKLTKETSWLISIEISSANTPSIWQRWLDTRQDEGKNLKLRGL